MEDSEIFKIVRKVRLDGMLDIDSKYSEVFKYITGVNEYKGSDYYSIYDEDASMEYIRVFGYSNDDILFDYHSYNFR